MVANTGLCLVYRAEIMEFQGAWRDALEGGAAGHGAPRSGNVQSVGHRPRPLTPRSRV
jgi:hypothetical protein